MLVPGVVVDLDGDAAQGGDFGGELGEAGVVLSVWGGEGWGLERVSGMAGWEGNGRTARGRRLRTWWVVLDVWRLMEMESNEGLGGVSSRCLRR